MMHWWYRSSDLVELEYDDHRGTKAVCYLIFILYIFIVFIETFQCGIVQWYETTRYNILKNKYIIVNAVVCDISDREIQSRKGNRLFGWEETKIQYQLGEQVYNKKIYSYNDVTQNQIINIAVNKNNHTQLLRCEPYQLTGSNLAELFMGWIPALFLFLYWCVLNLLNNIKEKKRIENNACDSKSDGIIREEVLTAKQKDILSFMCVDAKKYAKTDNERDYEQISKRLFELLDVKVNTELIWIIVWGRRSEIFKQRIDTYIKEVREITEQLRQRGLFYEYYYISKEGEHYLVGKKSSERLYLFSYSLGITNTKYESIYDYIIERGNNYDSKKLY